QQTIAFVKADHEGGGFGTALTVRRYLEGACTRAEQLGFKVEDFWLGEKGMSEQRMSDILRARGISGLLLAPLPLPMETVSLQWDQFAPVVFGYSMRNPKLHRVTNHQIQSMHLALAEARRLGYRRIGLALDLSKDVRVDRNWTTGMLPYQMSIPPEDRVEPFLPGEVTPKGLIEWVRKERPEVVLGSRRVIVDWLREAGWQIPEKIGFVSLEYYPDHGDVAGVDHNSLSIGATAVELVVEQLFHNQRGVPATPKVVMIEGLWHPGGTVSHRLKAARPESQG
ncbi:MAG: LacI family transcriptional regulator, partial [Opitutales bacterium]